MKVLVACEFSAVVRDAFRALGHDAWSCDLLPTEGDPAWHIQGDALDAINAQFWDLLIAHPPCTYLSNSGVRWLYENGKGAVRDEERWRQMERAAGFFRALWFASIDRVAIENPIQHRHCRIEKPSQIIQPFQHGHGETKATGLWLRNLPPLKPSNIVEGRTPRVHHVSPGPDRWKERSRTLPGIARAMAQQWST